MLPLQQRGNHAESDDPPKTLSSRFQTLSKARSRWNRPETPEKRDQGWLPAPATPAAAGDRHLQPIRPEAVQNRSIGTLAGRAQAHIPSASVQCAKSAQTIVLFRHSWEARSMEIA